LEVEVSTYEWQIYSLFNSVIITTISMLYTEKCKNSSQKSSLNSSNFSFANKNFI